MLTAALSILLVSILKCYCYNLRDGIQFDNFWNYCHYMMFRIERKQVLLAIAYTPNVIKKKPAVCTRDVKLQCNCLILSSNSMFSIRSHICWCKTQSVWLDFNTVKTNNELWCTSPAVWAGEFYQVLCRCHKSVSVQIWLVIQLFLNSSLVVVEKSPRL